MRLATLRTSSGNRAVRVETDRLVDLGVADVGVLLADVNWREIASDVGSGRSYSIDDAAYAAVIPAPKKIICVGLNYRNHILEMGRELPQYPTLFGKYPEALIGANDDIQLPPESDAVDWEAELAVIIGKVVRRASESEAEGAIAGFSIMNDVTMRDWQYRSPMWLQGKTFEGSAPFGPVMVTPDELSGGVCPDLSMVGSVDEQIMQKTQTSDLLFTPVDLIQYISTIMTLHPGDVIATGTPGGVGHARKPPMYLRPGSRLVTEIHGIGRLENVAVAEVLQGGGAK